LTEEQYQELAEAVDEIAERLRAMGHSAPISLHDILNASNLREIKAGGAESPEAILRELAEGHKLLSKRAKEAADVLDEEDDDFGNDRMIARIGAHDKAAWMLNSLLA
jgi:starvation-inducible DNA-binding protein